MAIFARQVQPTVNTISSTTSPAAAVSSTSSIVGDNATTPLAIVTPTTPSNNTFTSPTAPVPTSLDSSSGLSGGAIAGVAIGAAIAGALIALLIAGIIMQRRRRRPSRQGTSGEKPVAFKSDGIDDYLPLPAAESDLQKSVKNLSSVIENHVDNYYHSNNLAASPASILPAMAVIGYDGRHGPRLSGEELLSLLVKPTTRPAAIQQLIAQVVVNGMKSNCPADRALLPAHIIRFCRAMPPVEQKTGSTEEFSRVFNKWRHMSAYLLSTWRTNREALKADDQTLAQSISSNIQMINSVLAPFVRDGPEMRRAQEENLRGILLDAAGFGLLLFSQPSMWRFDWSVRQISEKPSSKAFDGSRGKYSNGGSAGAPGTRTIVVFPALGEETYSRGSLRFRQIEDAAVTQV